MSHRMQNKIKRLNDWLGHNFIEEEIEIQRKMRSTKKKEPENKHLANFKKA